MRNIDNNENNIMIDETKANRIHIRVYNAVKKNMSSNEKTSKQMIDEIKKIIETEVKKCY